MNYLAHLFLSPPDDEGLIGGFIADGVRATEFSGYSTGVQAGIVRHREVDRYTDTHAVVARSKQRLRPRYGHYSAVIVDVFYDHFLARDWRHYCDEPLADYADRIGRTLTAHEHTFPYRAARFLRYMNAQRILTRYATLEGIERALTGLASRARYESGMETAVQALAQDYDAFEGDFAAFFPELRQRFAG